MSYSLHWPRSDDRDTVAYAERKNRLLVTSDNELLAEHDALGRSGALFGVDDRLTPFDVANIIDTVADYIEQKPPLRLTNPST